MTQVAEGTVDLKKTGVFIIDADTHVTEPPDVWTARMSKKKWGDLIPSVRVDEATGAECWFSGTKNFGPIAGTTFVRMDEAGRTEHFAFSLDPPKRLEDVHPASYDAKARLEVMNERNVLAQVLYPNFNFVIGDMHAAHDDREYKLENLRAYNDWLVEWASVAPERLIPVALVPYFDVAEAAKEVYRAKEIGHRGIIMTGKPQIYGQPFFADRHWDPLWRAAEECEMPVSLHLGAGPQILSALFNPGRLAVEGGAPGTGPRTATDLFLDNAMSFNDLLMSGVLARFPGLKVVSVEGGIGWANFLLESLDFHFEKIEVRKHRPEFEELPSFYFRRQCYVTYWFEQLHPFHIERLGSERIMFETDFPHSTSLEEGEMAWAYDVGLSLVNDEVKERVLWRNAAELYDIKVPQQ